MQSISKKSFASNISILKMNSAGTECGIWKEHCGFRQGRGCIDQVFAVRQVCEKYLMNGKMYFRHLWIWRRPMI